MYEIEIPSLYMLAGIMVYATIHHLTIALKTSPQLYANVVCRHLSVCGFGRHFPFPFPAGNQFTLSSSAHSKRRSPPGCLFYPLFIWFIALRTGIRPRFLLVALTALFAFLFVVNLAQPYSLQYDQLDGIYYAAPALGRGYHSRDRSQWPVGLHRHCRARCSIRLRASTRWSQVPSQSPAHGLVPDIRDRDIFAVPGRGHTCAFVDPRFR